jgi:long-chain acyl-CoA synthetase
MLWERIEDKAREKGKYKKLQTALKISQYLPMNLRRFLFADIHKQLGGALQLFACGGAPLDPAIGMNWGRVGIPVIEGYGATEITAIATVNPYRNIRYGSAGKPVEGINLSLDENKEIIIQSEAVSSGYYHDYERTKAVFTSKGYRTGDIGELDSDGFLRIKGRDVFKIVLPSGEKVFVEDLEGQIVKDARVKEVCVVAQRVKNGDRIHAYFILHKDIKDSLKSIVAEINSSLESKQQIVSYANWLNEDFPRTPTLKVDRKQMFDLANENIKPGDIVQKDTAGNFLDIIDVLAKVSGISKEMIKKSDFLASDLGLDSLSRVELVSLAEEYLGLSLDEGKISQKTTVADLMKLVACAQNLEEVKLPTWQFTSLGQLVHLLALKIVLFPIHSYVVKLKIRKRIPLIPKGSIIIFNHPGVMDGVCVLRILAKQRNLKVVTDATASVWENKSILGPIAEVLVGGLPLYETGQKLFEVLKLNSDLLDQGYNLMFAPQGTMQRSDKEDPFKMGIGYLIKELNRPVTIVRIKDYRGIWPAPKEDIAQAKYKDLWPKRRGEAIVAVSKSINKDWSNMSMIQITNYLEEKYREM